MRGHAPRSVLAALLLLVLPMPALAAVVSFQATLGEEVAPNGLLDPGESVTVDVEVAYAPGEAAVNYQVDLQLSGDLASFSTTPGTPPPFGSPGSATCALPSSTLARCFGNSDLLVDPNVRVTDAASPVALGSFLVQSLPGSAGASLTISPGPLFTEELLDDPQNAGFKVGSALPLMTQGLDGGGNVLDVTVESIPADSDGDSILNDGDGSGVAGDAPCTGGATGGCDDNCPFRANAGQQDTGGQSGGFGDNGGAPDGIGDACQCGDVNGNGVVDGTDVVLYRRFFGGEAGPFDQDRCSVTGPGGTCDGTDVVVMRRTFGGLPPGVAQVCLDALP